MNPRTTAVLFLVAAVVVGGVWWNENVRKPEREAAEAEAEELFPGVEPAEIEWVAFETSDGEAVRLERRDGGLVLLEPLVFSADATTVEGIVSALADTRSEGVIDAPQPPEVYGLEPGAAFAVRFRAGGDEHVLRVGGKTPVGGNTYATTGEGERVFTVPSFRAAALRRSLHDLREKRVLRFDRAAVERIELDWEGGGVVLERGAEDAWRVVEPIEDAADEETVDALLTELSFLRAEGFLDDPPPDDEVGLARPAFEAKLVIPGEGEEAGRRVSHLVMGQELSERAQRAVRAGERSLYLVSAERIRELPRTVSAYRFKELARFAAADARRLELAFHEPGAAAHVVVAERGPEGWTSSPEALAPGRAARMVAELSALRARDIVAESMGEAAREALGLAPPRVRLRVRGEGAEGEPGPVLAEVLLGEADAERGIVAMSAEGERVYRLPFELAEHLPVSREALRNRFLSKEEAPAAPDAG